MFRTYDVRGVYGKEVTEANFARLGAAFSSLSKRVVLGMDYRRHNESLAAAFCSGFSGEIESVGVAPTPLIAFACKDHGFALTASHNPVEYNGAKPLKQKRPFFNSELLQLKAKFESVRGVKMQAKPLPEANESLIDSYLSALPEFGGAVFDLAGGAACAMKNSFGESIYDEPDPSFSKHDPEPKDSTLGELKKLTSGGKKLGVAFDGDADRAVGVDRGVVADGGTLLAFLCANHVAAKSKVVVTLDVSDEVFLFLEDEGFNVISSKVGDVFMVEKALEAGAAFGGERSGHYSFFKHMPYTDGIYAAALLSQHKPGELLEFAQQFKNTTLIEQQFIAVDFKKLAQLMRDEEPQAIETIDGVKARFADYCVLIRASNTEPKVRVNVEAKTREKALAGMVFAKKILNAVH